MAITGSIAAAALLSAGTSKVMADKQQREQRRQAEKHEAAFQQQEKELKEQKETQDLLDNETLKQRQARAKQRTTGMAKTGRQGTILTSPLGDTSGVAAGSGTSGKTLLGT